MDKVRVIIKNSSKAVRCFKSMGKGNLRIFPGMNEVSLTKDELDEYFKTPIAIAIKKECLSFLDPSDLTDLEEKEAKKSKSKNDEMNKLYKSQQAVNKKVSDAADKKAKKTKTVKVSSKDE